MKITSRLFILIPILTFVSTPSRAQQARQPSSEQEKTINVSLAVEPEGPGGLFAQAAEDLTLQEVTNLSSLIAARIQQLKNHKIVPDSERQTHLFLSVVVAKLRLPGGRTWFVASSALSIGTLEGSLGSLTHDVIVERDLQKLASAVAYYLTAVELRGMVGRIETGPKRR